MHGIGDALKRKIGPLPAWAWALVAGGALYFYRQHTAAQTGTALQPSQTPAVVQPDTTLQPGESVYDPNTGQLTTAPGGDTSGGGGTDPTDEIGQLAAAIAAAIEALAPGQTPNDPGTDNPTTPPNGKGRTGKGTRKNVHAGGLAGAGAGAGAGGTGTKGVSGVGRSRKPGKPRGEKPSSSPQPGQHNNKRSPATLKGKGGHKNKGAKNAPNGRARGQAEGVGQTSGARPRPSSGAVRMLRNRPVAAATPKARPAPTPQHRPSAPAPRPAPRRPAPHKK